MTNVEWMLNYQNFAYQNFVLKNFQYYTATISYWSLSGFVMLGHEIFKYFCAILDKKDPPEEKSYTQSIWAIIEGYIAATNHH